jgi:hypothetical protein
MCNLYSITRTQEAMRRLFRVKRDFLGNFPGLPAVFPDTMAPVVRTARDGERELALMRCDERDKNRATASLMAAKDAIVLDTTALDVETAFKSALAIVMGCAPLLATQNGARQQG